ncbi:MAG: 23S rRNA pseudouridine(2605) synthase RluB [Pseudomonadota bacterium]
MKTEKLQKVLANLGLGSRREIEKWIDEGRVRLNDRPAKLGDRASLGDKIHVDDKLIKQHSTHVTPTKILLYHKPEGEICSRSDPEGRRTVFEALPVIKKGRWIMIGRLDINSSGLLLFTNDGELANHLMHPASQIEREYQVRVLGDVTSEMIKRLTKGVRLEEGMAHFKSIKLAGGRGANRWYKVILTEGKNREVRRLFESQGLKISRLMRVRFGSILLPRDLHPGRYRYDASFGTRVYTAPGLSKK